jgi:hypothetical protein
MSKTKKVTITLTPETQQKAKDISKDLFGIENISGLFGFLICEWGKKEKKKPDPK